MHFRWHVIGSGEREKAQQNPSGNSATCDDSTFEQATDFEKRIEKDDLQHDFEDDLRYDLREGVAKGWDRKKRQKSDSA